MRQSNNAWRMVITLIAMTAMIGCEKAPRRPVPTKKVKLEKLANDPTISISNIELNSTLWLKMARSDMERALSGALVGEWVRKSRGPIKLCQDVDVITFHFVGESGRTGWVELSKGCSSCQESYFWTAEFEDRYLDVPDAGIELLSHYADSIKTGLGIAQKARAENR